MERTSNSFTILRLLFALFVVVAHSFVLSGKMSHDFLFSLNNQYTLSYIGVAVFFVISGYLIFQSLQRSKHIIDYFLKRFLRLFPGLLVMLLGSIFFLQFVYLGEGNYFHNKTTWSYLYNNLSLFNVQYFIDGIFEYLPYRKAINGSLWSLAYEFSMYVIISLLFFISYRKTALVSLCVLFLGVYISTFFNVNVVQDIFYLNVGLLIEYGLYFLIGSLFASIEFEKYIKQVNKKHLNYILFFLILLICIATIFHFFNYIKFLTLPVIILLICIKPSKISTFIEHKIGDLSYGIYIYSFPIQQGLMYYFMFNYIELLIYSSLVSVIFAYFSWHIIEKQALKLKRIC